MIEGNFQITIASLQDIYNPGAIIEFEVIITNIGTESETISWPVEYPDALFVLPADCVDINLCIEDIVFSYPPWFFYVPGSQNFAPGDCRRGTMTWDTNEDPAPAGSYMALGGLVAWPVEVGVDVPGLWILPEAGVMLPITISDTVAGDKASWDQIKAHYSR